MRLTQLQLENRKLNIKEYEERCTVLQSRPRVLFVELTRNCNLRCPMCRIPFKWDPSLDMPYDVFAQIADELFPYAELVDLRGWGESTMLPNFLDYVEYAAQFPCQLQLYTNLTRRVDTLWEVLMRHHFVVGASFDGASPETFEKIRHGSRLLSVLHNLELLVKYRDQYGCPSDNVLFNTIVQRENLKEIVDIITLAHNNGIQRVKLSPIIIPWEHPNNLAHYRDEVAVMLDDATALAQLRAVTLEVAASLHPDLVIQSRVLDTCIHPWSHCYISSYGSVGFCDCLIAYEQYLLGSLHEQSFSEIWNGPDFVQLREEHVNRERNGKICDQFGICNWCYQYRYITDVEARIYPPDRYRPVTSKQLHCLYEHTVHPPDVVFYEFR